MTRRTGPLIPLHEAIGLIRAHVRPVDPQTDVLASPGTVLAADAVSAHAVPERPTATRDGWAVVAAESVGASPYAPVPLATSPVAVAPGVALPTGTDAVLPFDAVDGAEAIATAAPGEGVIGLGEHARPGHVILPRGTRLGVVQAATLRALKVPVAVRDPVLRAVPTRVEGAAFAHVTAGHGLAPEAMPTATDPDALAQALETLADGLVVIGRTGEGADDWTVDVLRAHGTVLFHGVALDPGLTAAFAMVAGRPVLAVPGAPDAALAVTQILRPVVEDALAGATTPTLGRPGRLTRKLSALPGLTRCVFARLDGDDLIPLGGSGVPLHLLASAHGCVVVPPSTEGHPAGATVELVPFTR